MATSLADILAALQNGVVALNNLIIQATGSFRNISSQLNILANNAPCRAYLNSNQTGLAINTYTQINFDTIDYDPNGWVNLSNHRITPNVAGTYLVIVTALIDGLSGVATGMVAGASGFTKNGSRILGITIASYLTGTTQETTAICTGIVRLNGSTDYVTGLSGWLGTSGTAQLTAGGSNNTTISVSRLGA